LDLFAAPSHEAETPTKAAPRVAGNYQVVSGRDDLAMLAQILAHVPVASLDVRAVVAGTIFDRPVGFSLSWAEGLSRYVPLFHSAGENASLEDVKTLFGPILSDKKRHWITADARNGLRALAHEGLALAGRVDDVGLAAYLLAPGDRQSSLEKLVFRKASHSLLAPDGVTGSGRSRKTFDQLEPEAVAAFSGEGADWALRLWEGMRKDLERENLWGLYDDLERPLMDVLSEMENAGIALDRDLFAALSREMKAQLEGLEAKAHQLAGAPFNVSSPKQLGEVLFTKLGLKSGRKTATGQISTDSDTLEDLKESHPLPAVVLEHREASKLLGTYVDVLPSLCDGNHRVHTRFNQMVAATGRLSSTDPNLQNIPIRGESGRRIREGFVASRGNVLIAADYSQIELRLLAHLSGDEALREVYRLGQDIHARTAAQVAGVEMSAVTPDMRRQAKIVNFGVVYGMGAHSLSQQLGVPFAEAKMFIDGYFAAYPLVKPWMEAIVEEGREKGFVSTILGRKRWIRELGDRNRAVRERAEREAANTPVQGSAADLVKRAMLLVDREIRDNALPATMLLQVHDELVFESPIDRAEEAAHRIKSVLEAAMELSIPLVAEAGIAPSWGKAH
jgi:DNA polymerase-1